MSFKANFSAKLEKLLFTEIKKGTKIGDYILEDNIYMPLKSDELIVKVKEGYDFDKIPMSFFVEGMFFVLGADEEFKHNEEYKEILTNLSMASNFIKSKIFEEVKKENYEEAFVLLRGVSRIEEDKEVYEKLLFLVDRLRAEDESFEEEEVRIINRSKAFSNFPTPYLYEAIIYRDKGEFIKALFALNEYEQQGGKIDKDIAELKQNLTSINKYDKGKELVNEEPTEALQILIPLVEILGDSAEIYYYIAVAYRNLGNHEKAIYYLNEASGIDNALLEVVNEYGINFASLGDFEKAAEYFKKAFEQNKSIELCTNLIMCYVNLGKIKEVEEFIKKGENIDPKDEILMQIKSMLKK